MNIERIFTATSDGSQSENESVLVAAGAGIHGDRYFGKTDEPGQNITFVEAEVLEDFARSHGRPPNLSIFRRNIVARGVRLNELVGREFTVGGVRFFGVELCEPCAGLGSALASASLTAPAVVKFFVRRGGLRADALSTGQLQVGAEFGASD